MDRSPADVRTIVYSFVVADLFHYGHLQLLQTAKSLGDYHICGVLTDEAAAAYRPRPIANFDERVAIISSIRCVDRVMLQDSKDPTANLRRIHEEFPRAEVVLTHGNDWNDIPGRAYVESIGGRIVQPEYYRRLSDRHIRQQLAEGGAPVHYEQFTEHFRIDRIVVFEREQRHFVMSTKANTLRALQPLLRTAAIEPMVAFRVSDWGDDPARILALIRRELGSRRLVVRSSAINEDTYNVSQAGAYVSLVNVAAERRAVSAAIDDVVASYAAKGNTSPLNQVLLQPHTRDVGVSGVVFTRVPQTSGPYYVINYDDRSGSTDTVTGGLAGEAVEIARSCPPARWPARWRRLLKSVQEIEQVIPGTPLDIEFALGRRGRVTIFQVRPLACADAPKVAEADVARSVDAAITRCKALLRAVPHLPGRTTCFSDMAFWNPAEIIGDRPHTLDFSLYRHVITDHVWHEALSPLGYARLGAAPLMIEVGGKPYIDLRCTCNALLPQSLPRRLRAKLTDYYIRLLAARPELHDKVEFEIIDNCFYFTLDTRLRRMRRAGFTQMELGAYRKALVAITAAALGRGGSIAADAEQAAATLAALRAGVMADVRHDSAGGLVAGALRLLDDCKPHGTAPFTLMARLAFIGKRLIASMVERQLIQRSEYERFMDSVRTVATTMFEDYVAMGGGTLAVDGFLRRYGHLRPGTYDICSPRYSDDTSYLGQALPPSASGPTKGAFVVRPAVARAVGDALRREGIHSTAGDIFDFIRAAIEAREYIKFQFTKNLSDALELIARAGERLGFAREDLAHLDIDTLLRAPALSDDEIRRNWTDVIERTRRRHQTQRTLSLPAIIFSPRDLEVVERRIARPNFITRKTVQAPLVVLNGSKPPAESLEGKVVMIEKADPGYDWLFTKRIAGLVTKYGGVASHMAIRCGEFGLPAAIGCGETIFQHLQRATAVRLDCGNGQVRPIA